MSNGTLYIVRNCPRSDEEGDFTAVDQWPLVRMVTSTGSPGYATEESIREREPTDEDMTFITPAEAAFRVYTTASWISVSTPPSARIFLFSTHCNIQWLYNHPPQFLSHYYREYDPLSVVQT